MSLGWGLRGYIGGGPLGAMIPGAMVALALCLLLDRDGDDAGVIAAFGAVGIGFGGQMTYGQTVGYSVAADTMWWGLLGLGVKGAIWGFLGGAVLGVAFLRNRYESRDTVFGLLLMVAGTWLGWRLINEPRLIYFSNPLDRPRPEVWAGLFVGAAFLLVWLRSRNSTSLPLRFALWGLAGGGIGFFVGGLLQSLGRQFAPGLIHDYWKLMEFTFGFSFGAALGRCAWRCRSELAARHATPRRPLAIVAIPLIAALATTDALPSRFDYTIAGAALLAAALYSASAAWQIAITMTYCAFSIDFVRSRPEMNQPALWAAVAITTVVVGIWVARRSSSLLSLRR
jgi:hypothetical protein